ncbi:inactive rhomboid protein 1 isoform X2 [Nematostella vectensis]|uniref:inactive rhomboid protein 1 isoform X2 n=1 Tax=Nematostella vectensis TaxID=45351 RepID=UPI002077071E|nr:inactive rhomboid protein 1 isoform X2 [Nematostella vectensis]
MENEAYRSTVENRDSKESIGPTCNPVGWMGRRRGHDLRHDLPEVRVTSEDTQQRGDRNQRWISRAGCIRPKTTSVAEGTPAGSMASLAPPGSPTDDTNPASSHYGSSTIDRARSIKKKIIKSTEQFFGLGDCEEESCQIQRKWTQRKKRHYGKRYGGFADVVDDVVDGQRAAAQEGRPPSVSSDLSVASSYWDPSLTRTRSRRKSVAKMAWKELKHKARAGTLVAEASRAQPPITALLEAGRSFSPAAIAEPFDDVDGLSTAREPRRSSRELEDEVFFDFVSARAKMGRPEKPLPAIPEDKDQSEARPMSKISEKGEEEEREPLTPHVGKDEVEGPPAAPQANIRGQRMIGRPVAKNANRRQYGQGLVGRWLNRRVTRKRLPSSVKKQLDSLSDHRPFFTYYVSFVQTVVLIVTLAVYGFAPIGFTRTERSALVLKSRQGTLVPELLKESDPDSFWIGTHHQALIHLGAKFAPCMRKDNLLYETLEKERLDESKTGCCIKTDNSGCMQTSRTECSRAFANFKYYTNNNMSRAVCGQDPQLCTDPPSVKPYEWNYMDITKWPICKKSQKNVSRLDYPHMNCEITARPCCIKTQARCEMLSRSECSFKKGYYYENATLCSQVDCLGPICGMIPFLKQHVPDQIYRLWMAIFLHAGIIHLLCTLVFNFTILRDLERMAGWIRISIIYIFSGIGGYLISAILIPYQVEVGPSGSMFGIIACLFVELIQSWQMVAQPILALLKLCGVVFLLLVVGLLPYVDNFAHMAGFCFGFCLAFIFLPYVTFGRFDRNRKRVQILVAFAVVIIMYTVGFIIFLEVQTTTCYGCTYLNCIPFTVDFCEPYNLGQMLQPRSG